MLKSFPESADKYDIVGASQFGPDFKWGVATAAYQIEGAYNKDGKGLSIWDVFTATKGKIPSGTNANVTCDFYHRYAHDLIQMHLLNIPNFRFSLSWSRIFPEGKGRLNRDGVDFYNRVIDFCLELGIEPWVTLYHWDLPQALENKGGWTTRDIIYWFSDYVACCVKEFGDRVKNWMVLNEPMGFTGAGYFLGIHAPGKTGLDNFLPAAHHAALCQAEGGRIIRELSKDSKIGTTFSGAHVAPYRPVPDDHDAAGRLDALLNRFFIEPLLGMGYPMQELKALRRIEQYIGPDDEKKLAFDMDFIGVQSYTREVVRHSYFVPFINAQIIKAERRAVETTAMNWEVYPESMYNILKKYAAYPNIPPIIVTENGAAFPDTLTDGTVQDDRRTAYIKQHVAQVLKAREEGVNVTGYFVWSLMDNFEWAEGYNPRFGLVYVDFKTQQRIIKSSGRWYSHFLRR